MNTVKAYLPAEKFYQRKDNTIRRIVLHWNGAERRGDDLARRMQTHKAFYDYIIDRSGVVYQLNPDYTKLAAKHVRSNNLWTVGICLISPGFPPKKPKYPWSHIEETVHGRLAVHTLFTPEQVDACWELCQYICTDLSLEMDVAIEPRKLSADVLDEYTITGHFQHQLNRRDPGLNLLQELDQRAQKHYAEKHLESAAAQNVAGATLLPPKPAAPLGLAVPVITKRVPWYIKLLRAAIDWLLKLHLKAVK